MYYAGEFRSLDQSVDPHGSLYKVLIFTGYDSTDLNPITLFRSDTTTNVGPYPTESVMAGWAQDAQTGHWVMLHANVPSEPVQLTMTDHPVKINYVGDGKLQKPYRCSTAELSFLQSTLNTDFINSLGQRVLVYVLKWKNEVQLINTNTYKNMITNETLSRTVKQYYDRALDRNITYYNDFIPWEKDNFCYDVVWAGFSTPEMLNTAFDHIVDKFTLQCQDALSTLKYTRFTRTDQMESMLDTIFRGLLTLGIYRNVYVTSNVHFAGATNDLEALGTTDGPALRFMGHQQDNFFDEDGIAMYYLDVFENMMNYLGLTMIPEGDSLYITNDHCIGNGHTSYKKYSFDTGNFLWIIPASNPTYGTGVDVDCADTVMLNGDKFCSSSTTLSSDVMVNKVSVECDEMRPDPLLPDITDDANFVQEPTDIPVDNQEPYITHVWEGPSTDPENIHYFEGYFQRSAIEELKLYRYGSPRYENSIGYVYPYNNWFWPQAEVTDADFFISRHVPHATGPSSLGYFDRLMDGVVKKKIVTSPTELDWIETGVMAMMTDAMDATVSSISEVPSSISFKRSIMFETWCNYIYSRVNPQGVGNTWNLDDKSTYWNPMMYIKSKPFLGNGKQYLNINGSFTYYNPMNSATNFNNPEKGWVPVVNGNGSTGSGPSGEVAFKFSSSYNYVWAKIKLGSYWLTESGRGQYSWSPSEAFIRLWCDNEGLSDGDDYRFKDFHIETTNRGVEGISILLPIPDGYADPCQLEIWIDRPIGPGSTTSYQPTCTLMHDFEVNIYSKEYVESRKRRNPDRDNTRYENEVVQGAVEEAPDINLIHSSTDTAGLSYAETTFRTIRRRTAGTVVHRTNPEVLNDGSGYYGIPEKVRINTDKHQGITPSVKVDTGVFNDNVHMHSRFLWNSQLPGRKFIVDSAEIDLEYEQCDITLLEVKAPDNTYTNIDRMNATRNYHRTRDIMFDGHVALRNPVRLAISHVTGNSVDYEDAPEVIIETDERAVGASTFNMDWATGEFRLTVPSSGGIAASVNNNHQVVVSTN